MQTLQERGARYGEFADHAQIAQRLQDAMRSAPGWQNLAPDQKQALTVIADKIARMLNGDPTYIDNWHDIVGYATLVEQRMQRDADASRIGKASNDNKPKLLRDPCSSDGMGLIHCHGRPGEMLCEGCPRA
jgi:hypothetical protein